MKAQPYIGITGYKTTNEQAQAARFFLDSPVPTMYGYLCSNKRLADKDVAGTQSPALNEIIGLARAVPQGGIPMVHYHTPNHATLAEEVQAVFETNRLYDVCQAVQLNVNWPPLEQIQTTLQRLPQLQIVLQLPERATRGLTTGEIVQRCQEYEGFVKYALIDPSGGHGKPFELEKGIELMIALHEAMPSTRIGIAGGFSGENVAERVSAIRTAYPEEFCIDAQGRIRTEDETQLDLSKVKSYANASKEAFYRPGKP